MQEVKFSYGKGSSNPMELHYFYRKWNQDTEAKPAKPPEPLSKEEVAIYRIIMISIILIGIRNSAQGVSRNKDILVLQLRV